MYNHELFKYTLNLHRNEMSYIRIMKFIGKGKYLSLCCSHRSKGKKKYLGHHRQLPTKLWKILNDSNFVVQSLHVFWLAKDGNNWNASSAPDRPLIFFQLYWDLIDKQNYNTFKLHNVVVRYLYTLCMSPIIKLINTSITHLLMREREKREKEKEGERERRRKRKRMLNIWPSQFEIYSSKSNSNH